MTDYDDDGVLPAIELIVEVGEFIQKKGLIKSSLVYAEFRDRLSLYQFDLLIKLLVKLDLVRYGFAGITITESMLEWYGPRIM